MNKIFLGVFIFAVVAMLGITAVSASGGLGFNNMNEEEKAEFQEQREEMRNAVESDDFEAWKALMNERIGQMKERLTEEEFESIQQRHQERAENGEGFRKGFRQGKMHRGQGDCPYANAE